MIKWEKLSNEDLSLIVKIVKRFKKISKREFDIIDLQMDISACHISGCPLRLKELLEIDDFNFVHDIIGIKNNINRNTGKLLNCFLPRLSRSKND